MSASVVYLQRTAFPADDPPKLGGLAVIDGTRDAVVCRHLEGSIWLCAYSIDKQEQIALVARLERKRFRKLSPPAPPAA